MIIEKQLDRKGGMMWRNVIILFLMMIITLPDAFSQEKRGEEKGDGVQRLEPMQAKVDGKDTMLIKELDPVVIFAWKEPPSRRKRKLIYNIKKVYPYARLASLKLWEYENKLKKADSDRERRKLMKQAEEELEKEFGHELKKLNFTQGRLLLKLIDRETGETSYELVQELRGKFTAFFWQSLARIFGYNLKAPYDPEGKDKEIEEIVRLIEEGKI
ncbi:MAG: DUF4294 domain-containing protein [Bacteroidales bacterium]|nr:DUF4294 domain-containing protein [Bacteroidales bacterium]MCF8334415.1 DUF4294 domain-containing protein [Bacteroidales bacterium]